MHKTVNILGSTGSIGCNTLALCAAFSEHLQVNLLSAHSNVDLMMQQIQQFKPKFAFLADRVANEQLQHSEANYLKTHIISDEIEFLEVLSQPHDITISAIAGVDALYPTIAAVAGCKTLGLANKEVVVCAYPFLAKEIEKYRVRLVPLDSEHNSIYRLIGFETAKVDKVIITASGGPFYGRKKQDFYHEPFAQALNHPTWKMGAKISIDSATLMNKGFELIETYELFGLPSSKVDILVDRRSLIHAIVSFVDGSSKIQANIPNMQVHIASALEEKPGSLLPLVELYPPLAKQLDFTNFTLNLESLDTDNFEAPAIARLVYETSDLSLRIRLNCVNDYLVHKYLAGQIAFGEIIDGVKAALDSHKKFPVTSVEDVVSAINSINRA